jgi:hypothetical protein
MSLHALGLAVTGNAGNQKARSMLSCSFLQHGGNKHDWLLSPDLLADPSDKLVIHLASYMQDAH